MEGTYLVNSTENPPISTDYGSVNPCCGEEKDKDCDGDAPRIESSFESKLKGMGRSRSCSCTVEVGECDCGIQKKSVQLEPWARHKTIAMITGLSLLAVWIIIIAIVGSQGKL